jgi:hypothetical protein
MNERIHRIYGWLPSIDTFVIVISSAIILAGVWVAF